MDIKKNHFQSQYKVKGFEFSSHQIIAQILKSKNANTILDVGCDDGFIGKVLTYQPKLLIGIDKRPIISSKYQEIFRLDIEKNNLSPLPKQKFEAIVLADILEHLHTPTKTLNKLRPFLKKDGWFIISVPNMNLFLVRIFDLFHFRPRMEKGLFDKTHLHDFNSKSIAKLLEENGLKIHKTVYTPIPLPILSNKFSKGHYLYKVYKLTHFLSTNWPSLFAYQIILIAKVKNYENR